MKVLILLLTVAVGCAATVYNVEHFLGAKGRFAGAIPNSLSKLTATTAVTPTAPATDDRNVYASNTTQLDVPEIDPAAPTASADSTDEVVRQYGEPERKEQIWDGTYVWYYRYYIVYVGRRIVIHHRLANSQAAAVARASASPSQRFWHGNATATTSLNGTQTGPATTNPGWKASNSTLGSVSLNGNGQARPGGNWQGVGAAPAGTTAARPVVATVHATRTSGATYRSGSAASGASSAGGQWVQH